MASLMRIEKIRACLSGRKKHSDRAMRGEVRLQMMEMMKHAQLSV